MQISRHGSVALAVRSVAADRNERISAIWLLPEIGRVPVRVSPLNAFDEHPRWSPDGTRLTVASAPTSAGVRALWLIDARTFERTRLTHGDDAAHSGAWSPDGTRVCFVREFPASDLRVEAETRWYAQHPDARRAIQLRRLTSLRARSDGSGYREHRAQLCIAPVADGEAPERLTAGDFDDLEPAWSPDGRRIAFVSNRAGDPRILSERNIWVVDTESGALRQLTTGFWLGGPLAWSPDGTHIACLGMRSLSVPLSIRLWLVATDGSGAGAGSDGFGAHLWPGGAPVWTASGQRVLAAGGIGTTGCLVAYDRTAGTTSVVLEADAIFGLLQPCPDGTSFVAAASTPRSPAVLVRGNLAGGALEPLVDLNAGWLAEVELAPVHQVNVTSHDGLTIGGWLVTPPGTPAPHPCVLDVHYGPNAAWGPAFAFGAQALAGRGFATLMLNPRGSTGFGDAFAAAADFGAGDYADLLAGLDALVAQNAIDASRLGIMGLSYGGFMAGWAIARTQRFRAAVSINGISNQLTWYLLSDTGLFFYKDRFGDPFAGAQNLAAYWEHSPLAHVAQIETPLLLLQSEDDYRCPIDQGEQLFGALVGAGKTVELVRFPQASHDLAGTAAPLHAYLAHCLTIEWFERFISVASMPARAG